jgi:MerR family transcriptional regulator/heat shock protein HspR
MRHRIEARAAEVEKPEPVSQREVDAEGQVDDDRALYIISVAAELAGVHPQTLRIYERKGLLQPARTAGNTRRYSNRDIERLRMIQRLTQVEGLNLAGVRMIVEMEDRIELMRQRVDDLQRARRRLRTEIDRLRQGGERTQIVPRSSVPRLRVTVRTRTEPRGPIALGPGQ